MKKFFSLSARLNLIAILFLFLLNSKKVSAQNVGIGTAVPAGKLQINHRSTTTNPGLLLTDSTSNRSGMIRFQNLGQSKYIRLWGYNGGNFSSIQYLDIESDSAFIATFRGNGNVGIGNNTPANKLDVAGDINLTGVLKINGNAGGAGQVLTSNGAGDPTWKSAAYSNDIRFSTTMTIVTGNTGTMSFITRYNQNATEIVINSSSIVINRSGLYHFEGFVSAEVDYTAGTVFWLPLFSFDLSSGLYGYSLVYKKLVQYTTGATYILGESFSKDIYLTAPATLYLSRSYSHPGGTTSDVITYGQFSGYLISE